jgi:hypothetical protein
MLSEPHMVLALELLHRFHFCLLFPLFLQES